MLLLDLPAKELGVLEPGAKAGPVRVSPSRMSGVIGTWPWPWSET